MRTKTSVSQEDYLKAIWELVEEGQPPISARLAAETHAPRRSGFRGA